VDHDFARPDVPSQDFLGQGFLGQDIE